MKRWISIFLIPVSLLVSSCTYEEIATGKTDARCREEQSNYSQCMFPALLLLTQCSNQNSSSSSSSCLMSFLAFSVVCSSEISDACAARNSE